MTETDKAIASIDRRLAAIEVKAAATYKAVAGNGQPGLQQVVDQLGKLLTEVATRQSECKERRKANGALAIACLAMIINVIDKVM